MVRVKVRAREGASRRARSLSVVYVYKKHNHKKHFELSPRQWKTSMCIRCTTTKSTLNLPPDRTLDLRRESSFDGWFWVLFMGVCGSIIDAGNINCDH